MRCRKGSPAAMLLLVTATVILCLCLSCWAVGRTLEGLESGHWARSLRAPPLTVPESEHEAFRIAFCFYGLARSTSYTLDSLNEHIFGPVRKTNGRIGYDTFVHTFVLNNYVVNDRAGETQASDYLAHKHDYRLLNATRQMVTSQEDFDKEMDDNANFYEFFSQRYWYREASAKRNIYRARHSLSMVWSVMESYATEMKVHYDAVVLLRPDVMFLRDLDVVERLPLPETTLFAPAFDTYRGVNDRFAYGDWAAMHAYTHRYETMAPPRQPVKLYNTEQFLKLHLERLKVNVKQCDMLFSRVRMNGRIYDTKYLKYVCEEEGSVSACSAFKKVAEMPVDEESTG
ncbi:unnamed protein product, partial [Chrysoparadoxa australica]